MTVVVVGSRLLMNILSRAGIEVKYLSDFITPNDVAIDCSVDPLEANCYDVVEPFNNVESYLFFGEEDELLRIAKNAKIIVAHKYLEVAARVSEEIKVPFMPNVVSIFLPEKVSFKDFEIPEIDHDSISYTLLCGTQAAEIVKFLNGEKFFEAPEALIVERHRFLKTLLRMRSC